MLTKEQFDKAMFIAKVKTPKHLEWTLNLTYEKYLEMNSIINKREEKRGWGACCLIDPKHKVHTTYDAQVTEDLDTGEEIDRDYKDGEPSYNCGECEESRPLLDTYELGYLDELIDEE